MSSQFAKEIADLRRIAVELKAVRQALDRKLSPDLTVASYVRHDAVVELTAARDICINVAESIAEQTSPRGPENELRDKGRKGGRRRAPG
jgi:hypothetical protein